MSNKSTKEPFNELMAALRKFACRASTLIPTLTSGFCRVASALELLDERLTATEKTVKWLKSCQEGGVYKAPEPIQLPQPGDYLRPLPSGGSQVIRNPDKHDWEGKNLLGNELLLDVIKVWQITPHLTDRSCCCALIRDRQRMATYVTANWNSYLSEFEAGDLLETPVPLSFKLVKMTIAEYLDEISLENW